MTCESPPLPARNRRAAGPVPKIALARAEPVAPLSRFALGVPRLDAALSGGLAGARLHELWPAAADDAPNAAGFALLLALKAAGKGKAIVWIEQYGKQGGLYPPGIAELGIDPARILFVNAPDEKALLRAAGDVVRSPAVAAMVIVPAGPARLLDLTASRRLTLFAERSGTTAILLRNADPHAPSAATTRWQVAAAPSRALEANAPGSPAFALDLVRQRGGAPSYGWMLEWDRDRARFAPLSRDLAADAGGEYLAAG